jgi:hypothetical protein
MFMGRTDVNFIMHACSYAALRVGHSLIHLTVSKVPRAFSFCRESPHVLIMWARLALVL